MDALREYRYRGVDKSVLSRLFLTRYWNRLVTFMPMWLAPKCVPCLSPAHRFSTITLIGFCFILVNVASIAVLMPDLTGPAPRWLYFSLAFGLFAYVRRPD